MAGYLDNYISANLKLMYKNPSKPYFVFSDINTRYSIMKDSKFKINSLPMLSNASNELLYHNYTDISIGVDFKNLRVSISHVGNYATATAILELK